MPPIDRRWFLGSASAWERTGATVSAPFAGVHLVEATKHALAVRDRYVDTASPPAGTTIQVPALAREGALLEVEAIALLPAE